MGTAEQINDALMEEAAAKLAELRAERDQARQETAYQRAALTAAQLTTESLLEAAKAVAKVQADFKVWAEAGVMRGLLPFTEADLRKASLDAFAGLSAAIAKAEAG